MYFDVFKKSWWTLRKNLVLFVPDLAFAIYTLTFGFLFLRISGILNFIVTNTEIANSEVLLSFLRSNIFTIVISFLIFVIVTFVVGASIVSIKYSMMRSIVLKKKFSLKSAIKECRKYVFQVIWLRILVFLVGVIVLFLLGLITQVILSGQKNAILISVWILFALIAFAFIKLLLMFRYPIMFFENNNALDSVKNSISYFKKNAKYVFAIFLIILSVAILFNLIFIPLNLLIDYGRDFLINVIGGPFKIVLITLSSFIRSLISLIFIVWADMFLFFSYKLKR
jgi:hypothetical protein